MADLLLGLRERLDRLAAGDPATPRLGDRAARLFGNAPPPEPTELIALDKGLDRAGVFTLADARLLASLMKGGNRAGETAKGLRRRVDKGVVEFERLLAFEERRKRLEASTSFSAVGRLEDLYGRLVRAVKVAQVLEQPQDTRPDLYELLPRGRPIATPAPKDARVAAAQYLVDRARATTLDVQQKRRDLDAAHELLLRLGSEVDRGRVRGLRAEVAVDRASLGGAASTQGQERLQQLASAARARDGSATWGAAMDLYRDAVQANDPALTAATRKVLETLAPGIQGGMGGAVERERARSFLGAVGGEGVVANYLAHYYGHEEGAPKEKQAVARDGLAELALDLDSERWTTFHLAVGAGRFFDVDEATAEEEPEDDPQAGISPQMMRVPYPTAHMFVDVASGIEELSNFIIGDPRMVLYDLASHRQLVRAFAAPQTPREAPRKTKRGAVRVYVCDASASMRGERARFRDAVLIAELNNLSVRQSRGLSRQPIYYSFFSDYATDVERVDDSDGAMRVVTSLFDRSPAQGRTDITYALESAFGAIRDARGRDPDLGRATVVLVTDGEDRVDLERIRAAKAPMGDVEITLNFISLGSENRDLKQLVLEQREKGKRAFYYHLTDPEIGGIRGDFDCGLRTLLPQRAEVELKADDPEVKASIDALIAVASEGRKPLPGKLSTGTAAARFEAYFPKEVVSDGSPPPGPREREIVSDLLVAACEAAGLAPADARAGEAVQLLEHLLSTYNIKVPIYLRTLPVLNARGQEAIEKIRLIGAPQPRPDQGGAAWG